MEMAGSGGAHEAGNIGRKSGHKRRDVILESPDIEASIAPSRKPVARGEITNLASSFVQRILRAKAASA